MTETTNCKNAEEIMLHYQWPVSGPAAVYSPLSVPPGALHLKLSSNG